MFENLKELGILGNFNPFNLFNKYRNRGISDYELEDIITDGVIDAYSAFDTRISNDFGVFAYYHVKGKIIAEFRHLARHKYFDLENFAVQHENQDYAAFDDGENLEDNYLDIDSSPSPFEEYESIPMMNEPEADPKSDFWNKFSALFTPSVLAYLIRKAFPIRRSPTNDPVKTAKLNRGRDILIARYIERQSWDDIAKSLRLASKQAAQMHDKRAQAKLIEYCRSEEGQAVIRDLLNSRMEDTGIILNDSELAESDLLNK